MKSKLLHSALALIFWLYVWEMAARAIDLPFAIPTVEATAAAFGRLVVTGVFWQTIAASLGRILLGLLLGTAIGAALAGLSLAGTLADAIIRPAMTVIRCTPVASFIMVLWIIVGRNAVPTAIAILMVAPILWQGLRDGYRALDPALGDVVRSLRASPLQRLTMYVLPALRPSFVTALVTAAGFAWKAGIAAEIITYTASSIGRQIADARNLFNGPEMMAWTITVILLSLGIEALIRARLRAK